MNLLLSMISYAVRSKQSGCHFDIYFVTAHVKYMNLFLKFYTVF